MLGAQVASLRPSAITTAVRFAGRYAELSAVTAGTLTRKLGERGGEQALLLGVVHLGAPAGGARARSRATCLSSARSRRTRCSRSCTKVHAPMFAGSSCTHHTCVRVGVARRGSRAPRLPATGRAARPGRPRPVRPRGRAGPSARARSCRCTGGPAARRRVDAARSSSTSSKRPSVNVGERRARLRHAQVPLRREAHERHPLERRWPGGAARGSTAPRSSGTRRGGSARRTG